LRKPRAAWDICSTPNASLPANNVSRRHRMIAGNRFSIRQFFLHAKWTSLAVASTSLTESRAVSHIACSVTGDVSTFASGSMRLPLKRLGSFQVSTLLHKTNTPTQGSTKWQSR
jgi:hypothetical protein